MKKRNKKVFFSGTVTFPIYIEGHITVLSGQTLREAVLDFAGEVLNNSQITPLITESETHPEMAD